MSCLQGIFQAGLASPTLVGPGDQKFLYLKDHQFISTWKNGWCYCHHPGQLYSLENEKYHLFGAGEVVVDAGRLESQGPLHHQPRVPLSKEGVLFFPFFDIYLQSLNDKWHAIQCMTHKEYWPLCRVLVRMVATSHVNHTNLSFPTPQPFLLIVSILVKMNWNLEKILRECIVWVSLPQKCSLPHPVGLLSPSRSKFSEWQKLPDTASESQTHGTWQQRRRSIRKTNSIMSTFNSLTSGRRCCRWRPQ